MSILNVTTVPLPLDCWHTTVPRRLNTPGISKEQLPILALQPFFSRHNVVREIQVQIKSNKIRELAVTVSAVHCKLPEGKQNQTKPFRMVFIFIERFFFSLYSVKGILNVDLFDAEALSMTSLYHTLSAKQQRRGYSILQRKRVLRKQNNLLLSILCVSFAKHYLTILFSLWKQKDF